MRLLLHTIVTTALLITSLPFHTYAQRDQEINLKLVYDKFYGKTFHTDTISTFGDITKITISIDYGKITKERKPELSRGWIGLDKAAACSVEFYFNKDTADHSYAYPAKLSLEEIPIPNPASGTMKKDSFIVSVNFDVNLQVAKGWILNYRIKKEKKPTHMNPDTPIEYPYLAHFYFKNQKLYSSTVATSDTSVLTASDLIQKHRLPKIFFWPKYKPEVDETHTLRPDSMNIVNVPLKKTFIAHIPWKWTFQLLATGYGTQIIYRLRSNEYERTDLNDRKPEIFLAATYITQLTRLIVRRPPSKAKEKWDFLLTVGMAAVWAIDLAQKDHSPNLFGLIRKRPVRIQEPDPLPDKKTTFFSMRIKL